MMLQRTKAMFLGPVLSLLACGGAGGGGDGSDLTSAEVNTISHALVGDEPAQVRYHPSGVSLPGQKVKFYVDPGASTTAAVTAVPVAIK